MEDEEMMDLALSVRVGLAWFCADAIARET